MVSRCAVIVSRSSIEKREREKRREKKRRVETKEKDREQRVWWLASRFDRLNSMVVLVVITVLLNTSIVAECICLALLSGSVLFDHSFTLVPSFFFSFFFLRLLTLEVKCVDVDVHTYARTQSKCTNQHRPHLCQSSIFGLELSFLCHRSSTRFAFVHVIIVPHWIVAQSRRFFMRHFSIIRWANLLTIGTFSLFEQSPSISCSSCRFDSFFFFSVFSLH